MNLFNTRSLRTKLIIYVVICFAVSIIAVSVYVAISFNDAAKESSYETSKLIADNYAQRIKLDLEKEIKLSSLFNELLIINGNLIIDKKNTAELLTNILSKNENIQSIYQIWESNTFSGKENDSLQRFTPYIAKINNNIFYEEENQDFIDKNKDIYNKIKKNRLRTISEIFLININNEKLPAITVITPIMLSNRFYGITAYNLLLKNTKNIINEPVYYNNNASLMLISDNNKIVFVSNKDQLSTKNINEYKGKEHELYKFVKQNKHSKFNNIAAAYSSFKIGETRKEWDIFVFMEQNIIIGNFLKNISISIIILSLIMIVGLIITIRLIRISFNPINKILHATERLSVGKLSEIEKINNNNEIGMIINFLNITVRNLREITMVSRQIASGNFDTTLKLKSKNDILSRSINKISDNFEKIEKETIINKKKSDIILWQRQGKQEVANTQRISSNNLNKLAFNLIRTIVNYSGASLGGIYINHNTKEPYIELIAAYAYGNKKILSKKYKHGTGLVGTAAIEKKKIILDKIPQDYLKIMSGLGDTEPEYLIILPIINNKELVALLEIAFIKKIENYKIQFIEQLSESIAFWLISASIHVKTNKILKKSQNQTKKLSEKEIELNKKIKKLQQIQNKYSRNSIETKNMLNAVNNIIMRAEYTSEGILIYANELFLKTLKFNINDIKGTSIFDIVKDKKEELKRIIELVKKGKSIKKNIIHYDAERVKKKLSASYVPSYNTENKITKIIFLAFDISENKSKT